MLAGQQLRAHVGQLAYKYKYEIDVLVGLLNICTAYGKVGRALRLHSICTLSLIVVSTMPATAVCAAVGALPIDNL